MITNFKIFESDFKKLKLPTDMIKPDDKIIFSNDEKIDFEPIILAEFKSYGTGFKPLGLWYGIGSEWLDHVNRVKMDRKYTTIHKIKTTDKVLKLNGKDDIIKFTEKYGKIKEEMSVGVLDKSVRKISWYNVAKSYSGIEIKHPSIYTFKQYTINGVDGVYLTWLMGWDISSGCIWFGDGIESIERIH